MNRMLLSWLAKTVLVKPLFTMHAVTLSVLERVIDLLTSAGYAVILETILDVDNAAKTIEPTVTENLPLLVTKLCLQYHEELPMA
jgi:hypothetical protein